MKYRYVLDGEVVTVQQHDNPPPEGWRITFVGRLGVPAPAEHFIVTAVDGDKLILSRVTSGGDT